jgi:uncharacterized membrane protein (UPF0182 family)
MDKILAIVIYMVGIIGGVSIGAILSMNDAGDFGYMPVWVLILVVSLICIGLVIITPSN